MIDPELLIRSRIVPSRSGKYQAIVPPALSRASTVSTICPVGPFKYRISKEPEPLKSMIGVAAVIERPRLRSIFVHADAIVQGIVRISHLGQDRAAAVLLDGAGHLVRGSYTNTSRCPPWTYSST